MYSMEGVQCTVLRVCIVQYGGYAVCSMEGVQCAVWRVCSVQYGGCAVCSSPSHTSLVWECESGALSWHRPLGQWLESALSVLSSVKYEMLGV